MDKSIGDRIWEVMEPLKFSRIPSALHDESFWLEYGDRRVMGYDGHSQQIKVYVDDLSPQVALALITLGTFFQKTNWNQTTTPGGDDHER